MENQKKPNKAREVGIELLRIVSMLLVVITHCIHHSGIEGKININSINLISVESIRIASLICNTCFLLISGYYMVGTEFKIKKILKLWGNTIFYSIGIYIILALIKGNYGNIFACFSPIATKHYWFITSYIALYFIAPFLNIIIKRLTKNQFKYILVILTICRTIFELVSGDLTKMIYIYLIGSYIKMYVPIKKQKGYYLSKSLTIIGILMIANVFIIKGIYNLQDDYIIAILLNCYERIHEWSNMFIIFAGICLFMKFKTINIQNVTIVRMISPSILAIYIIHEHINIKNFLWNGIFNLGNYADSNILGLIIILVSMLVFIACLVIDLTKRGIFLQLKRIKLVSKIIERVNEEIESIEEKSKIILNYKNEKISKFKKYKTIDKKRQKMYN